MNFFGKAEFLLICFAFQFLVTYGAKILFLLPIESKSMRNIFIPYAEALQETAQHQITIVGMYPPKQEELRKGIEELTIPGTWDEFTKLTDNIVSTSRHGTPMIFKEITTFILKSIDNFLNFPTVQSWVNETTPVFDLAIINAIFGDVALPVACHVATTCMAVLPPELFPWIADLMNSPYPSSYTTWTMTNFPMEMNFGQRMLNFLLKEGTTLLYTKGFISYIDSEVEKRVPHLLPVRDCWEKVAILLTYIDPVFGISRPSVPRVISVGCLHCRDPKSLKGEIANFINNSDEEGFIFFSLGSIVKSSSMSPEMIEIFISVFSALKQKIIWKFERKLENLPSNVKIFQWLPQQDILGHPKIRLFITHAGLMSLEESVYHGVPVLCFPVTAEQPGNAARVVERGLGESMSIHSFTKEEIAQAIHKLLSDPRYTNAAKKWSTISRDQPSSPIARAVYWTNYVIRHKGAEHLSGNHLNYFEKNHLDILIVLFVFFSLFMLTLTKSVYLFLSKVRKYRHSAKSK